MKNQPASRPSIAVWHVAALCAVLGAIATWPMIRHPLELPFDPTLDTFLFSWSFWWLRDSIVHLHSPFYSSTIFSPVSANLALATLSLPYGIFYLLISWLPQQIALPLAFFLLIQFTFAATGVGMFLLVKEFGFTERAALFAGIFMTLSTVHLENLTRVHLGCMELPLIAMFLLLRAVRANGSRQSIIFGLFLGLGISVLALSSQTYSLHFLIIGSILLAAHFVRHPSDLRRPSIYVSGFVALCVVLVICLPYLIALREFAREYTLPPLGSINPDVLRLFRPGLNQATFKLLFPSWTMKVHNHLFPGLLIYCFAIVGVFKLNSPVLGRWPFFAAGLIGLTLFPGTQLIVADRPVGITLPYHFIKEAIPFLHADRAPDRFFFLFLFFLATCAGVGIDYLMSRFKASPGILRFAIVVLPLVLAIENRWDSNHFIKPDRIFPPALEEAARAKNGAVAMGLPPDIDSKHTFFLQVRTGAALVDADYPRLSAALRYTPLRHAELMDLFNEPGNFRGYPVTRQNEICMRIKTCFKENKIETIYVIDDVYKEGYANRIQETRDLLAACGWRRIDATGAVGSDSFIRASVWQKTTN